MQFIDTILIIGRPGSGKGTQAKIIAQRLGWTRLSTGDRIKQIRDGNEPFSEIISWLERNLVVVNLQVSEGEVIRRMAERAKVEHRPDSDSETNVRERITQFDQQTAPAIEYFRKCGFVTDIDGEVSPEEVAASIEAALKK